MLFIKKSNISWLSRLLAVLLIVAVIAIIWVLKDIVSILPDSKTEKDPTITSVKIDSTNELAKLLVDKFVVARLPLKEKNNLLQAVNNSLQHLQDTNHNQALFLLQKLDLKASVNYLIESVKEEENSRESAKTWVDIGNLQQLQSSQLAVYAYKKASQFDAKNSNAWNKLGHFYRKQKQFTLAENAYSKVLESSSDATTAQAVALANFGLLYQAQGKSDKAEASYLKALAINEVKKNTASLASNNENLALLYKKKNDFELSEKHYLTTLTHYKTLEKSNSIANIQSSLASLYHQYKHLDKAKQYYQMALEIYQNNDNQKKIASSYSNLGILNQQQGQADKAKEFFYKSLKINQQIDQQQGIADQYSHLGVLDRLQKKFTQSEPSHLKSLKIYQELQHLEGVSQQQTNLGFLYQAWGQTEKACQYWLQSKQTLIEIQNKNRIKRIASLLEKHCANNKLKEKLIKSFRP